MQAYYFSFWAHCVGYKVYISSFRRHRLHIDRSHQATIGPQARLMRVVALQHCSAMARAKWAVKRNLAPFVPSDVLEPVWKILWSTRGNTVFDVERLAHTEVHMT